jgi:copper ion binding protein
MCTSPFLLTPLPCRSLPGVHSASVALLSKTAELVYDPAALSPRRIEEAVEEAGFHARVSTSRSMLQRQRSGSACADMGTGMRIATLAVGGMHCSSCSSAVEAALLAVPGVRRASVSLTLCQAEVAFDPLLASELALVSAVEDAGFEARCASVGRGWGPEADLATLRVGGMTCSSCSRAVEEALRARPGVLHAAVNLLGGTAEVRYNPGATGPRHLIAAVEEAGFDAEPMLEGVRQMEFVERNRAGAWGELGVRVCMSYREAGEDAYGGLCLLAHAFAYACQLHVSIKCPTPSWPLHRDGAVASADAGGYRICAACLSHCHGLPCFSLDGVAVRSKGAGGQALFLSFFLEHALLPCQLHLFS